jgi:hypothetical protein
MNFDYQDTQVEVTYLLGANNDRAFKKTPVEGKSDAGTGAENQPFEAHMSGMTGDGWALVSIADTPVPFGLAGVGSSQTSSYRLSWKRPKLVQQGRGAGTVGNQRPAASGDPQRGVRARQMVSGIEARNGASRTGRPGR